MDVSIKQFDCSTCEFNDPQSGAVIKVEDIEVDDYALEQALKQIIDDNLLTKSAQRVYIRKFTIRQEDYAKLMESIFFSAKLNGVATRREKTASIRVKWRSVNLRWRELKIIIRMVLERVN